MNRNNSDSSSSTRGELPLWQKLIVVGLVMFVLVVMGVGYVVGTDYSARRKTTTIINTIRLGLELTLGSKGEMIPLDFTYLRKHFGYLDTLAELRALRDTEKWQRVATHQSPFARTQAAALGLPTLVTDEGYDKNEMEQCDVGISECDALIAQTGTVLVTSKTAGGRALSCLPPHHVVVARREQMVSDLPAAFALIKAKHGASYPSMISFITGPSRTGDIERILDLGAHGPKKLTIFCL